MQDLTIADLKGMKEQTEIIREDESLEENKEKNSEEAEVL
jgi:hypothetical protein